MLYTLLPATRRVLRMPPRAFIACTDRIIVFIYGMMVFYTASNYNIYYDMIHCVFCCLGHDAGLLEEVVPHAAAVDGLLHQLILLLYLL